MSDSTFYSALRTKGSQRFLYKLYKLGNTTNSTTSRKRRYQVIEEAKNYQLDILIKVLRRIATKKILIHTRHLKDVKQSKGLPHLERHFISDEGFKQLKTASREAKIDALSAISQYHRLLYNLFH